MLILVGERHEFGFYRRAVARSGGLNLTVVERRFGNGSAQRVVHLLISICGPARQLLQMSRGCHVRETVIIGFAGLAFHILEVYRAAVDTYRCARLHSL